MNQDWLSFILLPIFFYQSEGERRHIKMFHMGSDSGPSLFSMFQTKA